MFVAVTNPQLSRSEFARAAPHSNLIAAGRCGSSPHTTRVSGAKGPDAAWWQRPDCCIGGNNKCGKTTEIGKPLVSFAYASQALAEAAATHLESALS